MPNLSDPLGPPKIVTGPEYMDALARLGYNVENLSSPLPTMFKIAQSGTNFLDSLYNQNMQTQQAQANLQYSLARTRSLNTDTDYNEKANQYRIDDLDMANQIKKATLDDTIEKSHLSRQQELENLHHSQNQNPQLEEELRQKNVQAGILTDEMKSQQQRNQQALDEWPMARADLNINPDDPDFEDKLVQFYRNHPNVATNLATKPMVDIQVKALESARSNLASVTEANNNAKMMMAMKATGDLPADTNIDALKTNPDVAHQTIVRGNVTAQQRRISEILSAIGPNPPPELRTQADDLRNAQNRLSTILGAPDGINQVANGAWSQFFDANGRLNAGLEGDISAMQTYAQERAKQGLAKPMSTTVTVKGGNALSPSEIRVENVPAGQEQAVTRQMQEAFKTEEERAQEKAGLQKNAQVKQTNDVADLMRNNPEIKALSEEAARTGNWTKVQDAIQKQLGTKQQPAVNQEGIPANKQSSADESRIRTSNNDYTYPHGAADVAGIDRNVWANAMSEEGAEPGLDPGTNHMSVFGLWRDKPGAEGNAYRVAVQNGPRSLEAYNAVTQTWAKWAADSKADPWKLDSPGMQELVLADVQHTGGSASVRQAIDSMGGFEAINKMDPGEAIRQYSRLRLSFWPGNAGRVQREGQWALANDGTLRGSSRVAKMAGGGLVQASDNAILPGTETEIPRQTQNAAKAEILLQPGQENAPYLGGTGKTTGDTKNQIDWHNFNFGPTQSFSGGPGFYNNPGSGKPYDTGDAALVGARVPMSELTRVLGTDAGSEKSVISSEVGKGYYQAVVAKKDGTLARIPIVDVTPEGKNRGLELTPGAMKLMDAKPGDNLGYKLAFPDGSSIDPTFGGESPIHNWLRQRDVGRRSRPPGDVITLQGGGFVSGAPGPDQVPAMLTSGEYVVNKDAVQNVGLQTLEALNAGTQQDVGFQQPQQPSAFQSLFGQVSNQSSVSNAPLFPSLPTIRPQLAQTSTPAPRAMPAQTPAPRAQPAQTPAVTTGAATSPIASTGGTTLMPQYTTGDFALNAHYLGDGRLSGMTTNFGHDVNGKPDTYMLSKLGGGSRLGAFGTDVVNPTTSGVSVPVQTVRAFIGNEKDPQVRQRIKSGQIQVEVTAPNGRTGRFNIVDLGPGKGENASLDMTGTAMRELGMKDNFGAVYRIVSY